jgi:CHASE3 domain sensor protein
MKLDLSVGQRLTIGFALMLVLFAAVFAAVSRSHHASARAEAAYTNEIVPQREKAFALERAVYGLGIDTRAYLISPDDLNSDTQRNAAENVREKNRALALTRKDAQGEALYRELVLQLNAYLAAAEKAVQERRHGTLGLRPERALGDARDKAVAAIRRFSEYQELRARAALDGMAEARDRVSDEIGAALLLALVLFLCISFITAQSIRRPARELLEAARGFERGQWTRTLAPAADDDAAAAPRREVRDEMAQLGRAFSAAAVALEERNERLNAQVRVAAAASCSLDQAELADAALMIIAEYVRADAAVVYVLAAEALEPIATYAADEVAPVRVGEGIVGEAFRRARAIQCHGIAAEAAMEVKLGFAKVPPRSVAAVPLARDGETIGVLLVGSVRDLAEGDHAFLRGAAAQLAIGLHNALAHAALERAHVRREPHDDASQHQRLR